MNPYRALDLPPVWLVLFGVVLWLQTMVFPATVWMVPGLRMTGWVLMAVGVGLIGWSAFYFRRQRTPIIPRREPTVLLTDGPFVWSRNPIYLADLVILVGLAAFLGAVSVVAIAPAFVWIIQQRFIKAEETTLDAMFGEAFRRYRARTRRWL